MEVRAMRGGRLSNRLDGGRPSLAKWLIVPEPGGRSFMAAKKTTKVTVEVDIEVLERLVGAADALSELATAYIHGSDDPRVRGLAKAKGKAKKKPKR